VELAVIQWRTRDLKGRKSSMLEASNLWKFHKPHDFSFTSNLIKSFSIIFPLSPPKT
jgi:hypothetical protein